MDAVPVRRSGLSEDGFATAEWVAMLALTLLVVIVLANVVAFQFVRAELAFAVDEGARRGSAIGHSESHCERVIDDLFAGRRRLVAHRGGEPMTRRCHVEATAGRDILVAEASTELRWWFLGLPGVRISVASRSIAEPPP